MKYIKYTHKQTNQETLSPYVDSAAHAQAEIDNPELLSDYDQVDVTVETEARLNNNIRLRDYLCSTDWYVVRFIETQEPIPPQIITARAEARSEIVD